MILRPVTGNQKQENKFDPARLNLIMKMNLIKINKLTPISAPATYPDP